MIDDGGAKIYYVLYDTVGRTISFDDKIKLLSSLVKRLRSFHMDEHMDEPKRKRARTMIAAIGAHIDSHLGSTPFKVI